MRKLEIVHRTHYDYARACEARRLPADVPPPGQPRSQVARHQPRDRAGRAGALDLRCVRQLDCHRFVREEPVTALEFVSTMQLEHYGMPPDVPTIEDLCAQATVQLPRGGGARPRALCRAPLSRSQRGDQRVGAPVPGRRGRRGDFHGAHPHVQGHPGDVEIRHALRARHAAAGDDARKRRRHLPRLCAPDGWKGPVALGLAARFITGYLYDPVLDKPGAPMPAQPGQPHAWMEVYLPARAGWSSIRPTASSARSG